jgi:hypothetical protein
MFPVSGPALPTNMLPSTPQRRSPIVIKLLFAVWWAQLAVIPLSYLLAFGFEKETSTGRSADGRTFPVNDSSDIRHQAGPVRVAWSHRFVAITGGGLRIETKSGSEDVEFDPHAIYVSPSNYFMPGGGWHPNVEGSWPWYNSQSDPLGTWRSSQMAIPLWPLLIFTSIAVYPFLPKRRAIPFEVVRRPR